jgi:DHA1 family bicyclomycin/chloramphenicol resistance-like MFS transporter
LSSALGSVVGRAFDGTTLPFTIGLLLFGIGSFLIVIWAERGKLFTRPHHGAMRDAEVDFH